MTESKRGPIFPQPDSRSIDRTRYSIYDDLAYSAITELKDISLETRDRSILNPLSPRFETLTQETQNTVRRLSAQIVFKSLNEVIDYALAEGRFDPNWLHDSCSILFGDAGIPNPVPKPRTSDAEIPPGELMKMRGIRQKDPTNIRLLNKGLHNLPHIMRREFRRLGVTLLIIQNEIIPEVAEKLKEKGVPKTYGPKAVKRIEVISEDTQANQRMLERLRHKLRLERQQAHPRRARRTGRMAYRR